MQKPIHILLIFTICGMMPLLVLAKKPDKQPKGSEGGYTVTISGYYTGTTTALVGTGTLSLDKATVTDPDGKKHNMTPGTLTMNGNHFTGTCTVSGGADLTLTGRLDGYVPDDIFKGARLLCSYDDGGTVKGRIGGTLQP